MKKIIAMVALVASLAACSVVPTTPVDCSTLNGPAAQSQCYGKISPQS